jgi:ABC-type microcin C transport system duplicated ATPase subunit YejF
MRVSLNSNCVDFRLKLMFVLRNGKVVEQGSVNAVIDSPIDPYTQHLVKLAATAIRK